MTMTVLAPLMVEGDVTCMYDLTRQMVEFEEEIGRLPISLEMTENQYWQYCRLFGPSVLSNLPTSFCGIPLVIVNAHDSGRAFDPRLAP